MNDPFQLVDILRPVVLLQGHHRRTAEAGSLGTALTIDVLDKKLCE
ncbi:MAG: hypothetical protein GTO62_17660 [Planctomycetales bacterium]|nr:hypothetical protein [Planctomycetales bacterium]NIP71057.1 hypothetical protein [Planctomycetales bacterium]